MSRLIAIFLLVPLFFTLSLNAEVIHIPDDAETFADALDMVEEGDTILVADGEYTGVQNCSITLDISIVIMSENGVADCILDCEDQARVAVTINAPATISGLTIRNSRGGILIQRTENVTISGCIVEGCNQLGIQVDSSFDVVFENCEIVETFRNEEEQGAGMRFDASSGIIRNSRFIENETMGSGAGIYISETDLQIFNSDFTANHAGAYGGAILATSSSELSLSDCTFLSNEATDHNGGAIGITATSNLTAYQCTFTENVTTQSAGAIYLSTSVFNISSSVFVQNQSIRNGGAVLAYNDCQGLFSNCLFVENIGGIDGGGIAGSVGSMIDVELCDFVGNLAGSERENGMGGGLYMGSNTVTNITNSIFWDNDSDIGLQLFAQNAGNVGITNVCVENGVDPDEAWTYADLVTEDILEDDPVFEDGRDPEFSLNGFFLNEDSPCVDFGLGWADEVGMENMSTQTDFYPDEDEVDLGFHYSVQWFNIVGRLYGRVTDVATDEPIAGTTITTSQQQQAISDEEGNWEIHEARACRFDVSASADGYNSLMIEDNELAENEELEVNFELTHPEFNLPLDPVAAEMDVNSESEANLTLRNTGNGILNWAGQVVVAADADLQPREMRQSIESQPNLKGVLFVNHTYIMAVSSRDENLIVLADQNGEVMNSYDQPGEGDGMSDLAWDGSLIWGARDEMIYGFTLDGEIVHSFEGPRNPTTGLAWDTQRNVLWAAGMNSPVSAYNEDGNEVDQVPNPNLRLYGLAFWELATDGRQLFVLHDLGDAPRSGLTCLNIENDDPRSWGALEPDDGGRPSGAFISAEIHPYSATLLTTPSINNAGRIDIWHIEQKQDWVTLAPLQGSLDPDASEELTVSFNSDYFREGVYEAELQFTHNASGGEAIIDVSMVVIEGPAQAHRRITLARGWNLVSANLQPNEPDIRIITEDLVNDGSLRMVKDGLGHFYLPAVDNFYNMDGWSVEQAYWLFMNRAGSMMLDGVTVRTDEPIALEDGWHTVSYYPQIPIGAATAFSGISDVLTIAKDGDGRFYSPEYDFNLIGSCRQGKGYLVNMTEARELVWTLMPGQVAAVEYAAIPQPALLGTPAVTGADMSLLAITPKDMTGEIGVYADDVLVGSGVIVNGRCGVAIRGDNPLTPEIDGATEGMSLQIKRRWDDQTADLTDADLLRGSLNYATDAFTVVKLGESALPMDFAISTAYPNPFNGMVSIQYTIPSRAAVDFAIHDLNGRLVEAIHSDATAGGVHTYVWNAKHKPSGVYFCKIEWQGQTRSQKLMLLK